MKGTSAKRTVSDNETQQVLMPSSPSYAFRCNMCTNERKDFIYVHARACRIYEMSDSIKISGGSTEFLIYYISESRTSPLTG